MVSVRGYHGTLNKYGELIVSSKSFNISNKPNEWLGRGIYFWDELDSGEWWATLQSNKNNFEKPCVLECDLCCDEKEFLDLDVNMDKLIAFAKAYKLEAQKNKGPMPNFKNNHQVKSFFCTEYKKHKGVNIVSYTFSYSTFNDAGFEDEPIKRKQICATDNSSVNILKLKEVLL